MARHPKRHAHEAVQVEATEIELIGFAILALKLLPIKASKPKVINARQAWYAQLRATDQTGSCATRTASDRNRLSKYSGVQELEDCQESL